MHGDLSRQPGVERCGYVLSLRPLSGLDNVQREMDRVKFSAASVSSDGSELLICFTLSQATAFINGCGYDGLSSMRRIKD